MLKLEMDKAEKRHSGSDGQDGREDAHAWASSATEYTASTALLQRSDQCGISLLQYQPFAFSRGLSHPLPWLSSSHKHDHVKDV